MEAQAVQEALDELKGSVAQLRSKVEEAAESGDPLDREAVEKIAEEVAARSAEASKREKQRRGFNPDDMEDAMKPLGRTPSERMNALHTRNAKAMAQRLNKDAADIEEFQRRGDELLLLSTALKVDPRQTEFYQEQYLPMVRAMDTQTTAEGQEFVPKLLSGSLIERINLALKVAALFPTIDMPSNPYDIPAYPVARQRLGSATEQTADTGQTKFKAVTPASRKTTLTAVKFAARALVSKELEEDAIIPVLEFIQTELVDYIAADLEDTLLNGDTAATHMDNDTTAADDPRKNWNGLRKLCPAGTKTDAGAAALSTAMLRTNRKKMGKYGVDVNNLVHILGIAEYIALLSDTNVQTIDKYGANATLVSGELAKVDGIPIVLSEYVRQDLDATGVNSVTGANNIKTAALTMHRKGFVIGRRREVGLQLLRELYAESDQDAITISHRRAFGQRLPVASENTLALHYNVST